MINLELEKKSEYSFNINDKNGVCLGSVFTTEGYKEWLLNPRFPVSDEFHKKKHYICDTPETACERLQSIVNEWVESHKRYITEI